LNHVSFIFKRALGIYKNDLRLWKSFIDFAVQYQYKTEQTFDDAVKKNPTNADMWILCGKWHAEFNNSADSARNIFQRGVKLVKDSARLWFEFFKLEMMLAVMAAKRPQGADKDQDLEEEDMIYDYDIPMLIYAEIQSSKALRFNSSLRFDLLDLLSNYPCTSSMQNTILSDTLDNFRHDESVIYKCLTWRWNVYGVGEKETLAALKKATDVIPTSTMWQYYAMFCKECFNNATNNKDKKYYLEYLLHEIYPLANDRQVISSSMLHDYIKILRSLNLEYDKILQQACKTYPNDISLWLLNIELSTDKLQVIDSAISNRTQHIFTTDEEQRKYEQDRLTFWMFILDQLEQLECNKDPYYIKAIKECGNDIKIRYFDWSIAHGDVNKCVNTIFAFTPNNERLYRHVLKYYGKDWEGNYDRLVKLYGKAITEHGTTCEDFWIGYIVLMKRRGELKKVHNLYYQAMKSLQSTDAPLAPLRNGHAELPSHLPLPKVTLLLSLFTSTFRSALSPMLIFRGDGA
jgi:hypothetical protein